MIDFSHVNLLDFSCADEVVAKLLLRFEGGAPPQDAYFLFRGVREDHLDAIEAALERYQLALVMQDGRRRAAARGNRERRPAARVGGAARAGPRRGRGAGDRARRGAGRMPRRSSTALHERRLVMRFEDTLRAARGDAVSSGLQPTAAGGRVHRRRGRGDADRGPQVRLNSDDARARLLVDGELVWIYGPRRHELAPVLVDDSVPRGDVVVRDIAGVSVTEIVRLVKPNLDARPVAAPSPNAPRPLMPRPPRRLGLSTLAVTGGATHGEADTPVVQPLVQSVNFVQEVGTADGLRYPRYGNTPNAEVVQRRLALLEGAEAGDRPVERDGRDGVRAARPAPPRRSSAREPLDLRRHARCCSRRSSRRWAST